MGKKFLPGWKVESSIAKILACIMLLTSIFTFSQSPNEVRAAIPLSEAEYLVDEDFSFLSTGANPSDIQVSGWDVQKAGGKLSYEYNKSFKISDTSNILPVSMTRKFVAQGSGVVTLEYRFKPTTTIDGLKWQFLSGTTEGLSIITSGSNLCLETSAGVSVLQAYAANTEYGVKVVANIDNQKADVYINGVLRAAQASFKNTVANLDRFRIKQEKHLPESFILHR